MTPNAFDAFHNIDSNFLSSSSGLAGGFVGEHEAGQRLFQVAHDPRCSKSGVYWSWNGGPREGRGAAALEKGGQISGGGGAGGGWDSIFENDQSSKVLNIETATKLFNYATQITGAEWPELKQVTSPCPTLMVIGAVTQGMVKREELKRMREMGRPGIVFGVEDEVMVSPEGVVAAANGVSAVVGGKVDKVGSVPKNIVKKKVSKRKQVILAADRAMEFVLGNTVGRVARFAGRRILGKIPETAKTVSFYVDAPVESRLDSSVSGAEELALPQVFSTEEAIVIADLEDKELLEQAIAEQLRKDANIVVDSEDEALFAELYEEEGASADKQSNTVGAIASL